MSLKVVFMKIENINKETLKFFSKAFDPTYQIHTTLSNKIIDFDTNLIKDFQFARDENNEYFGLDVISILNNDKNYQYEFIKTFSTIINEYGCGLCAINSTISVNHLLKIPAIYLILIMVEKKIIGCSEVKIIKLYNFLEITKFISGIFCENLTSQILNLTTQFKDSVQNKSIYFAYESLKSLSTFIPSKTSEKINQQNLANLIFNFHKSKNGQNNKSFIYHLFKSDGYINIDKNIKIQQVSMASSETITQKNCIPFNSLERNHIIQLN